jgi:hypothetical protein
MEDDDIRQLLHATYKVDGVDPTVVPGALEQHPGPRRRRLVTTLVAAVCGGRVTLPEALSPYPNDRPTPQREITPPLIVLLPGSLVLVGPNRTSVPPARIVIITNVIGHADSTMAMPSCRT